MDYIVETSHKSLTKRYLGSFGQRMSITPGGIGAPLIVFSSVRSVLSHIRKHMLNTNEVHKWLRIQPEMAGCLNSNFDAASLSGISRRLETDGKLLRSLYGYYVSAIEKAMNQASRNDWLSTGNGSAYAVGLSGLLVIVNDGIVRTAFFPGHGVGHASGVGNRGDRGIYRNCFKKTVRFMNAYDGPYSFRASVKRDVYRALVRKVHATNCTYANWRELHNRNSAKAA